MNQNDAISVNNPAQEKVIPIDADPTSAALLGLSDTWVLGWLGFGILFTIMPFIVAIENTESATPGAIWRTLALVSVYWFFTTPFGFPRWLSGYRMARRGIIVVGTVDNITIIGGGSKRAHRLNVSYQFEGQSYKAIANPMGKDPKPGDLVLVAIRRDRPSKNRIVPYDFRLDKRSITDFRQRLGLNR